MMDMMMIGSLSSYTKTMKMQMKWQQKKASGDYTPGKSESPSSGKLKNTGSESEATWPELPKTDKSTQMMQQIRTKMASGKKLSSDEMEFLKENDPETYRKAKNIELEQEAYEQELKRCKTKEEVQRTRLSHAAASLATVKNVENDPHIPEGKKLELVMEELMRTNAMNDTYQKFTKSGAFRKLPTEAERKKAEEDLEEARKAELGIEDKTDEKPENVHADFKQEYNDNGATEDLTPANPELKEDRELLTQQKMTRLEAEATPEARKVRRAKAQAAYAKAPSLTASAPVLDIKIE